MKTAVYSRPGRFPTFRAAFLGLILHVMLCRVFQMRNNVHPEFRIPVVWGTARARERAPQGRVPQGSDARKNSV